jgi:hypothetical protein
VGPARSGITGDVGAAVGGTETDRVGAEGAPVEEGESDGPSAAAAPWQAIATATITRGMNLRTIGSEGLGGSREDTEPSTSW